MGRNGFLCACRLSLRCLSCHGWLGLLGRIFEVLDRRLRDLWFGNLRVRFAFFDDTLLAVLASKVGFTGGGPRSIHSILLGTTCSSWLVLVEAITCRGLDGCTSTRRRRGLSLIGIHGACHNNTTSLVSRLRLSLWSFIKGLADFFLHVRFELLLVFGLSTTDR